MGSQYPVFERETALQISNLLSQAYSAADAARKIDRMCHGDKDLMGRVAVLSMGMGHVDLAEEMCVRGADPFTSRHYEHLDTICSFCPDGNNIPVLTVPWLLARWNDHDVQTKGKVSRYSYSHPGPRTRDRMAVLAHVMAHPGRWPVDVNAVIDQRSALVSALGRNNCYDRHGKSRSSPGYRVPEKDILEYAQALVGHGADINLPGTRWSALAACIPDHDPAGPVNMDRFDWAVAAGADPMHMPHCAWARAISEDVDISYGKRGAGPRAKTLDGLGVPLVSPVDVPAATSPLVQAVRRQARWAIDRMVASEGFDARWRDPDNGNTLLTTHNRTKKATAAMLATLPAEHLADVVNADTRTPALHMAVESLDPNMVKLLLDLGADPDALDRRGKNALEATRLMTDRKRDQFQAVADMLKDAGGTIDGPVALVRAAKATATQTIDELLGQGVDVYARDKLGRMAAQLVLTGPPLTYKGLFDDERGARHAQAIETFVRHGFDVNAALDDEGTTLLHYAVERCSAQAVELLIGHGANPNAVGKDGKTPLHMWDSGGRLRYYEMYPEKLLDMAAYLVRAGAEPWATDAMGRVCLDEAGERIGGLREAASQIVMEMRTASAGAAAKPRRI